MQVAWWGCQYLFCVLIFRLSLVNIFSCSLDLCLSTFLSGITLPNLHP